MQTTRHASAPPSAIHPINRLFLPATRGGGVGAACRQHRTAARRPSAVGSRRPASCLFPRATATMLGARRRGRPHTAWMDNKTWTGLPVEESVRTTEDTNSGESTSMVWPTVGSRTAEEQNRTEHSHRRKLLLGPGAQAPPHFFDYGARLYDEPPTFVT